MPDAAGDPWTRPACLAAAGAPVPTLAPRAPEGCHVRSRTPPSGTRDPDPAEVRGGLVASALAPVDGVDAMRALLTTARMVRGATAGTVLRRDGGTQRLAGLHDDPLLAVGSPVLAVAWVRIADGQVYSSFLWPLGGRHAPDGHTRVTVLVAPVDAPEGVGGVVVLSPMPELHGLTPRELEVLGFLVDGCSNQEIARTLVVAQRTVAAHIEHLLVKLGAPTRTLAAVRADRGGLYVPAATQHSCAEPDSRVPEHRSPVHR